VYLGNKPKIVFKEFSVANYSVGTSYSILMCANGDAAVVYFRWDSAGCWDVHDHRGRAW